MLDPESVLSRISQNEARQNFLRSPENLRHVRAMVDSLCPVIGSRTKLSRQLINNNNLGHLNETCSSKANISRDVISSGSQRPDVGFPCKHFADMSCSGSRIVPYSIDAILGLGSSLRDSLPRADPEHGQTDLDRVLDRHHPGSSAKDDNVDKKTSNCTDSIQQDVTSSTEDVTSTTENIYLIGNGKNT